MAEPDNPLVPIQQKVVRIHSRLLDFFRNVLVRIKPMMQSLQGFLANVRKAAKEIAAAIGAKAVTNIIKAGARLLHLVTYIEKLVIEGIKMSIKIMVFIKKAAKEPQKAFKTVKAMVARLAKVFRVIVTKAFELMASIDPVEIVLNVIHTMKMMLQMVFTWVAQVSPIAGGVKKAKALIRKSVKMLRAEAKAVTELVKEANKLKPA